MSYIQKMSIQGIRSFGPDDSDRQVLRFQTPLTLILGPNGTGKTSIIECLKYITTGSMPAGGSKQSTFIHDPKIAHETTVKAQVRLAFTNITGRPYTINRSMQATQLAKTVRMQTLDGTLQWTREDGTKESITSRCADLDREMVSLLGVGKPVIEYVIFCHQEDSCWPLSEGKALKQKFDDIFASTRYVKALDNILKARKELQGDIKEDTVEIKYLKANKDKVQQLESDLSSIQARYAASRESTEEVKEKLAPIEEKLLKLSTKDREIFELHTAIEKLKSEREQMKKAQKELLDNIENEFTGSTEELEQGLADFGGKVTECEEKLKQYERENQRLETQLNEMSDLKTKVLLEMGKLEQEAKAHKENMQKRQNKVQQVAEQYDISGFSGKLTDRDVDDFREKLEEHRKKMQTKGRDQRTKLEEQEQKIQARIDEIRKSMSALETEIRLKNETMKKNKDEVRNINQKLGRVEASSGRLSEIKRELKQTKQDRDETDKNINVGDMRNDIEKLSADKSSLDTKFKQLDAELSRMHQESNARTQLDMLKKDKSGKEDKVRKLISKNEDTLVELLGEVPDGRIGKQLETFCFQLEQGVEKDLKTLQKLRMQLAGKTQEETSIRSELTKKQTELGDQRQKIQAEIGAQNIDEGLGNLEETLRLSRESKGVLEGTSAMFNKFKSKLQKDKAPCPLCHRAFDEEAEIHELIDELESKLRTVPQRLEDVEREIETTQTKFNRVLQLKPVQTQIGKLEDKEIPGLEKRLEKLAENNEVLAAEIAEKDIELKTKQNRLASGKSLVPDMMMVDRYQMEMRDLDKKIATQSAKVSGGDHGRTLQQVQQERDDTQESLENVRSSYERKQKKLMDHERKLGQLDATLNELTAEKLNIERDLQEQKENEQRREELLQNNEILSVEILECQEQIQPLTDDLKRLKREREQVCTEKDAVTDRTKDQMTKLQERSRDIKTIQESIDRYVKAGRDTALADCREKQRDMEEQAEVLDTKRNTLAAKIEKRREDLQTQKLQERNLQDNLSLRRKQKDIDLKTETIADKQQELGGLDVRSLEKDKRRLREQQDELVKEKHKAEGRQQTLVESIRNLKKELETDMYVDAEKKYTTKRIKLRTTELASGDLDKYYKAMDHTIMRYHTMKIAEINKIIRELWRNTYKGNDIETIEIRSDEDEGLVVGKRRTFNYRVVMIKGDAPIDMRGRCSAGQKVLASIIIRLALAETFCLNCGVMTLDEPTTNLDRENIESLAFALVEIIKSRSKQKNFQLVVITHDEDFLELLGRSEYVDKFVKVRKNEFGCSRLVEADVQDLGTR